MRQLYVCRDIEHLGSLKNTQEARVSLSCASGNSYARRTLESWLSSTSAILSCANIKKNACALASITELIAQKARTLWRNVHSCTKLFNMLNIRRWWWHRAVEKSAYANSNEWRSAQLMAQVCAGHKDRYAYFQATLTLALSSSLPIWASYCAAFLIKWEPYCFETVNGMKESCVGGRIGKHCTLPY